MDAEAVARRVRQGIDEAVHHALLRRGEFRILAAARIDGEPLAAERCRHFVGVQPRGVDDGAGGDLLGVRPHEQIPSARDGAVMCCRPWQKDDVPRQRTGRAARQRALPARRCRCRETRAPRQHARAAHAHGPPRHRRSRALGHHSLLPRACSVTRALDLSCRVAATIELSAAAVGDAVALAELVQQRRTFDAKRGLQRSGRVVDPGVDHAAVVGARLHAGARVSFEDARR